MQRGKSKYTIGEVAKLSGISVKTLRYYEQEGILSPAMRNPENGYRYYSGSQLMQLMVIKDLKLFSVSLDDLKDIIQKHDNQLLEDKLAARIKTVTKSRDEIERQLTALQYTYQQAVDSSRVLQYVRGQFCTAPARALYNKNFYQITVEERPEEWVLYTRYRSDLNAASICTFVTRCLELQCLRDKYNLYQAGCFTAIFHDGYTAQFIQDEGDLELVLPVSVQADFRCQELKRFGGFLTAYVDYVGHYKDSFPAYLALQAWIGDNGYELIGPPMESYLVLPCVEQDPNSCLTRIAFPIKKIN